MSCSANNFRAKSFRFLLWIGLAVIAPLPALATQSVTLFWHPSADTNVAGYRIYYGTVSQNYTNVVTVGNVTNAAITGLADGTTYYFAATTTDAFGDESAFSNEASFSTAAAAVVNQPPTLNSLANLTVYQNAGPQSVVLSGITAGSPGENQVLKVTATTSNANLTGKPTVTYTSPSLTGTLAFRPSTTLTGTAVITVTVNDGGKSNNIITQKFSVTVIAPPNPLAPKIARPLTNSIATAGQTIALGVTVTGKAPFKYQWKYNGVNLAAATSPTLTLKNLKTSQAGGYSVTVSNAAGSTNSIAVLSVYPTTAATLTSLTPANGQFGFAVNGVPGYKYVVQASSDLQTWTDLQTNVAPFTFTDTNASSFSQRYYRTYYHP